MSFDQVEQLKREWTDRHVVVAAGIPELRRFASRTGQVKTVNMNGRALVQFDSSEDIAWYDIDLSCLKAVEAPAAGKQESAPAKAKAAAPAKAKPSSPAAGGKKLSPLEQARQQGAAGSGGATRSEPAADSAAESAAAEAETPEAAPAEPEAKPSVPTTGPDGQKLSPLELARLQGPFKG